MAKKKMIGRVRRREPASRKEVERLETIREKVREEFPPSTTPRLRLPTGGIAARLRSAREAQGLTWYAVAKRAGIPNPGTVRDIEYGRDTKLSSIEAVAGVLGLRLELVGVGQRDG
ncbi:MAG: helix-turn-helix transcriptional regulator [Thermoguttaceae bacterium]